MVAGLRVALLKYNKRCILLMNICFNYMCSLFSDNEQSRIWRFNTLNVAEDSAATIRFFIGDRFGTLRAVCMLFHILFCRFWMFSQGLSFSKRTKNYAEDMLSTFTAAAKRMRFIGKLDVCVGIRTIMLGCVRWIGAAPSYRSANTGERYHTQPTLLTLR